MKELKFVVDEKDMELLCFIYSLGRHRSEVICYLLREYMNKFHGGKTGS